MKDEYDFSKAERGKFYRPGAKLQLPGCLDDEVKTSLQERAKSKGIEVNRWVNDMLRREIELIAAVK